MSGQMLDEGGGSGETGSTESLFLSRRRLRAAVDLQVTNGTVDVRDLIGRAVMAILVKAVADMSPEEKPNFSVSADGGVDCAVDAVARAGVAVVREVEDRLGRFGDEVQAIFRRPEIYAVGSSDRSEKQSKI